MLDLDGVVFGLSEHKLGLLIMAPMIIGVGVLLRRKRSFVARRPRRRDSGDARRFRGHVLFAINSGN